MNNNRPRIGQELLDVPMGDMIREMAFAIAEAQMKLDQNSIDVAEMMGGLKTITDDNGNVTFEDSRVFFGNEKLNGPDAILMHNTTTDLTLKSQIRAALGDGNYKPGLAATTITAPAGLATDTYMDYQGSYWVKSGTSDPVEVSYDRFEIISTLTTPPSNTVIIPRRMSMMSLGFTPTFYQFVDTIIEVKISIKYTQEGESSISVSQNNRNAQANLQLGFGRAKAGRSISTSQVNASYSQKYSYSAEGSSLLRTKLVPIPPPVVLEDRIRRMMEEEFNVQPTT
jgi:hypothetical protein